jgi:hypothetical protein
MGVRKSTDKGITSEQSGSVRSSRTARMRLGAGARMTKTQSQDLAQPYHNALRLHLNSGRTGAKAAKEIGRMAVESGVEMVGGSLTIASEAGEGTTVRAEVPFMADKES